MKRYAFVLLLALPSSLHAEIFTWKDSRGTTHYTNSMYEVPVRYQSKARVLNLGIDEKGISKQPQTAAPSPVPAPAVQPSTLPAAEQSQPQKVTTPSAPAVRHRRGRPSSSGTGSDE